MELVLDSRLQRGDPVIRLAILQLRRDRTVATGQLRKVANHLMEKNGLLLFDDRIVVPREAKNRVLSKVHAAGQFGQRRTLQLLRRSYVWVKLSRDAKECCKACLPCQKATASNRPREPLGGFITTYIGPGDLVAMDVATLPWADEGYRYFIYIVDVFMRYLELVPLKDQRAALLVREFERGWIFRGYGVPKGLLTDQAPNIDGRDTPPHITHKLMGW